MLPVVTGCTQKGRVVRAERPQEPGGQRMIQVEVLLAGGRVVQRATAIEAPASELVEDCPAVDPPDFTGQPFVEASAFCRFAMLIGDPGLVLDPVVDGLAEPALTLSAGLPHTVDVEELQRLPGVTQQAVLQPLCLTDVIVV